MDPVIRLIGWITAFGLAVGIGVSLLAFSTLVFKTWAPFIALLWACWLGQDLARHGYKPPHARHYRTNISQQEQDRALEWWLKKGVNKKK